MEFSYLGLSEPIDIVNSALLNHTVTYRRTNRNLTPPLKFGGIYGADLQKTANFAAKNDMAVYTKAYDMFSKSDIILVFLPCRAVKSLAASLRGHGITGKIICHFTPSLCAEVLDFGADNTYISMFMPTYYSQSDAGLIPDTVLVEGYGPKMSDIEAIMNLIGINYITLSRENKLAYLAAASFLSDFPRLVESAAHRLMKMSLYSAPQLADSIMEHYKAGDCVINSCSVADSSDYGFFKSQSEVLSSLGIDDISTLFATMLLAQQQSFKSDSISTAKFDRMCKKLLKYS